MANRAQQFWDKQAGKYDAGEKAFEQVYREVLAKTKKYLSPGDHVLDFGCATGTRTLALAGSVRHIHGLDFSGEMIREALKKKEKIKVGNATFSRGSIFDESLEKESFDAVIAYAVLQLLEDYEAVIRRIRELLKPGGYFISTTPLLKEKMNFKTRLNFTLLHLLRSLGLFPLHLNRFTVGDVENLLEQNDFQLVETERIPYEMTVLFLAGRKK
ncbi:MAG: class I SAM-dependent methyltransferase [Calditrichaceae bacterium]